MYQDYWQLNDRPFPYRLSIDSTYPFAAQQAGLLRLQYCVENSAGCALILGESGLGKTTLVRQLEVTSNTLTPFLHLAFPGLSVPEQLRLIYGQLTDAPFATEGSADELLIGIGNSLRRHTANERHPVLCFDDAQLLSQQVMTEVILALLNLREIDESIDFSLILCGQPILFSQLARHPQIHERIAITSRLSGMTESEASDYISTRLAACGASAELFTLEATKRLHEASQGNPRRLNRLCDMALLVGCADQLGTIDASQIDAVSSELLKAA